MARAKPGHAVQLPTTVVAQHYRVEALAELLGVSAQHVSEAVATGAATRGREGIYPVYKPSPKVVLIPAFAVQTWLDRCRVG